jgi:hypothetical protein
MIIRSFSTQYRLKSNRKKRRAKRAHACKTGNPILSFTLVDTIHGFLVSGFTLQKGNQIVPKNVALRHRWSWSQCHVLSVCPVRGSPSTPEHSSEEGGPNQARTLLRELGYLVLWLTSAISARRSPSRNCLCGVQRTSRSLSSCLKHSPVNYFPFHEAEDRLLRRLKHHRVAAM